MASEEMARLVLIVSSFSTLSSLLYAGQHAGLLYNGNYGSSYGFFLQFPLLTLIKGKD